MLSTEEQEKKDKEQKKQYAIARKKHNDRRKRFALLKRLGLHENATEEEVEKELCVKEKQDIALKQLKKDKIRIAKRMEYEKLVEGIVDMETKKLLLERDDAHVEEVLKQFGIKIEVGETIRV